MKFLKVCQNWWISRTLMYGNIVRQALSLKANDFEDALQYYSARSIFSDSIVTRNVRDFVFSEIPVLTPSEFLMTNC